MVYYEHFRGKSEYFLAALSRKMISFPISGILWYSEKWKNWVFLHTILFWGEGANEWQLLLIITNPRLDMSYSIMFNHVVANWALLSEPETWICRAFWSMKRATRSLARKREHWLSWRKKHFTRRESLHISFRWCVGVFDGKTSEGKPLKKRLNIQSSRLLRAKQLDQKHPWFIGGILRKNRLWHMKTGKLFRCDFFPQKHALLF